MNNSPPGEGGGLPFHGVLTRVLLPT